MPDRHEQPPKPPRAAPPPFAGPPHTGALSPKTRADRPTLPPFSPPFARRPTPPTTIPGGGHGAPTQRTPAPAPPIDAHEPRWLTAEPNDPSPAAPQSADADEWFTPEEPAAPAPAPASTGIAWLDSPAAESSAAAVPAGTTNADADDVFGWDPAEERGAALDAPSTTRSLDALKEVEPWALPGAEVAATGGDDVADALERIAARIRSGDLVVPGASTAASDEALLASVLAALLQRARG